MILSKRIILAILILSLFTICGNYVEISPVNNIIQNNIYQDIVIPSEVFTALESIPQEHRNVVLAICYVESRFTGDIISSTGDYGIMQINRRWHDNEFDFDKMLDIEYNIYCGYTIFSRCLTLANNDIYKALEYYNGSKSYVNLFKQLI